MASNGGPDTDPEDDGPDTDPEDDGPDTDPEDDGPDTDPEDDGPDTEPLTSVRVFAASQGALISMRQADQELAIQINVSDPLYVDLNLDLHFRQLKYFIPSLVSTLISPVLHIRQ